MQNLLDVPAEQEVEHDVQRQEQQRRAQSERGVELGGGAAPRERHAVGLGGRERVDAVVERQRRHHTQPRLLLEVGRRQARPDEQ